MPLKGCTCDCKQEKPKPEPGAVGSIAKGLPAALTPTTLPLPLFTQCAMARGVEEVIDYDSILALLDAHNPIYNPMAAGSETPDYKATRAGLRIGDAAKAAAGRKMWAPGDGVSDAMPKKHIADADVMELKPTTKVGDIKKEIYAKLTDKNLHFNLQNLRYMGGAMMPDGYKLSDFVKGHTKMFVVPRIVFPIDDMPAPAPSPAPLVPNATCDDHVQKLKCDLNSQLNHLQFLHEQFLLTVDGHKKYVCLVRIDANFFLLVLPDSLKSQLLSVH